LAVRDVLEPFEEFQEIYNDLRSGKANPSDYLHFAGRFPEGDYYSLTEGGWQAIYFVDFETRTCRAVSLAPVSWLQTAKSHRTPKLI
jgi:hypothetical protein